MSGTQSPDNDLISRDLFVKSVRDLGLETLDATCEFVDNSFDANAKNIWITVRKNGDDLQLIIEDDGEGMAEDEIVEALKFGGQIDRDHRTTGKFGFGLPSAAFCQGDRTEVYSKTADQNQFYFGRLDVDELLDMDQIRIPDPKAKNPHSEYDLNIADDVDQGTVIVLPKLRSPDRKTVNGLIRFLRENLSQTYREILAKDREIRINGESIQVRDPLMALEESVEAQELATSEPMGQFEFPYPEYGDGDRVPKVVVDLYKLPIQEIVQNKVQGKYNINQRHQGFYIIRENREIGQHQTLSLFTRHNDLNYFRGRIHFTDPLDDLFGVQTNKSRFALDPQLRKDLKDKLTKVIDSLRSTIKEERQKTKNDDGEKDSRSERTANSAQFLPQTGREYDEEVAEEKRGEISKRIEDLEDQSGPDAEQRREYYNSLLDSEFYFSVEHTSPPDGSFYSVEYEGPEIRVLINPAHPFSTMFYEKLDEDAESSLDSADAKMLVELLLIAFAKREDTVYSNEKLKNFYERERREWSSILFDLYMNADEYLG